MTAVRPALRFGVTLLLYWAMTLMSPGRSYSQVPVPADTAADTSAADTSATDTSSADTTATNYPVEVVTGDSAKTVFAVPLNRDEDIDTTTRYTPFRLQDFAARRILSASQSQKQLIDVSIHHDAGDFLRGQSAFFSVDYLSTPLRHTVAPYTLPGPRLSPIFNGRELEITEHLPEQDALPDFNDVPTASASDIYLLHGPVASFLGGGSGVAGIWMEKLRSHATVAESRLEAQKGAFGYALTKGMISESTKRGYSYTAALEYRKASFVGLPRDDDSYHQFWELEAPLSSTVRTTSSLRMYRRNAEYQHRPITVQDVYSRHRRDRDVDVRLEYAPNPRRTFALQYHHLRNESNLEIPFGSYRRNLDELRNSLAVSYDIHSSGAAFRLSADGGRSKYEINNLPNWRNKGVVSAKVVALSDTSSGLSRRVGYAEVAAAFAGGYGALPKISAGLILQNAHRRLSLSSGVTPVFPRQYELDLPNEIVSTFGGLGALTQQGNPVLQTERQYTGALELWLGDARKSVTVVITGGRVVDGINWRESTDGSGQRVFSPINEDFTYASAMLNSEYTLTDWLSARGSAALYHTDYDLTPDPPYSPDYNLFAGVEVRRNLDFIGTFFTGYAEVSFPGVYRGYDGNLYGQQAIVNARLSARIKSFTFNYVFENALNTQYFAREEYFNIGRYNWYWVTWDFLD